MSSVPLPRASRAVLMLAVILALTVAGVLLVAGSSDPKSGRGSAAPGDAPGFDPPVALRPGEAYSASRLSGSSDDLLVTEWIRSVQPLDALTLAVPRVPGLDPASVTAVDLAVRADGRPVPGPTSARRRAPATVELAAATVLEISYTLRGAVQTDPGGTPRALARLVSLDTDLRSATGTAPGEVSVVRTVTGAQVLNLACTPRSGRPVPVPCGRPVDGVWQARRAGGRTADRVQAQLDLDGA